MADGHFPLQTQRRRPLGDQFHRKRAQQPRLMQVDIQLHAMTNGNIKNRCPRCFTGSRSTVDGSRPPITSAPIFDRFFQQVDGAWPDQHAALGERNQLHGHLVAKLLAGGHNPFEMRQARFSIDVDMGADVGDAGSNGSRHLTGRLVAAVFSFISRRTRRSLSV